MARCVPTGAVSRENGAKSIRTERGADVETMTWLHRDPVLVQTDELLDELECSVGVKGLDLLACEVEEKNGTYRKGDTVRTGVHALHVHVRAEEGDLSRVLAVCLHALEYGLCIVENSRTRLESKWSVWLDLWRTPTVLCSPGHRQHMVRESVAKLECAGRRGCFWIGIAGYDEC